MRRLLLAIASVLFLSASTGCLHHAVNCDGGCGSCAGGCACGSCGGLLGGLGSGRLVEGLHQARGWRHQRPQIGPEGPPVATYAYPYYTLRGPRDFLADDSPSIGY